MRTRCAVCKGLGTVDRVLPPGAYGFSRWPQDTCQNCDGAGWVGTPENLSPVDDVIRASGGNPDKEAPDA